MAEGSLPACAIVHDVVGYEPTGLALTAKALTAGFPCQVWAPSQVSVAAIDHMIVFLMQENI